MEKGRDRYATGKKPVMVTISAREKLLEQVAAVDYEHRGQK